jgi:hypothetical protein
VSRKFGDWYQKTNKTEDTNTLTLLATKIIAILHSTRLATFIKLLETVSKGLFSNRSQNRCHTLLDCRRACDIVVSPGKLRKLWDSLSELRSFLCERQLEMTVLGPALLPSKLPSLLSFSVKCDVTK